MCPSILFHLLHLVALCSMQITPRQLTCWWTKSLGKKLITLNIVKGDEWMRGTILFIVLFRRKNNDGGVVYSAQSICKFEQTAFMAILALSFRCDDIEKLIWTYLCQTCTAVSSNEKTKWDFTLLRRSAENIFFFQRKGEQKNKMCLKSEVILTSNFLAFSAL